MNALRWADEAPDRGEGPAGPDDLGDLVAATPAPRGSLHARLRTATQLRLGARVAFAVAAALAGLGLAIALSEPNTGTLWQRLLWGILPVTLLAAGGGWALRRQATERNEALERDAAALDIPDEDVRQARDRVRRSLRQRVVLATGHLTLGLGVLAAVGTAQVSYRRGSLTGPVPQWNEVSGPGRYQGPSGIFYKNALEMSFPNTAGGHTTFLVRFRDIALLGQPHTPLRAFLDGTDVEVRNAAQQAGSRVVTGRVYAGEVDLQAALVERGFARVTSSDATLLSLQTQAQRNGLGAWNPYSTPRTR